MAVVSREVEMACRWPRSSRRGHRELARPAPRQLGYVLVVDDLTELLLAQNPPPCAGSRSPASRTKSRIHSLRFNFFPAPHPPSSAAARNPKPPSRLDPELTRLVEESSHLIEREVGTLAALVNEFSQFVRFPRPNSKPPASTKSSARPRGFLRRLDGIILSSFLSNLFPPSAPTPAFSAA